MKQTPAVRSIQWKPFCTRITTAFDDKKSDTNPYQINVLQNTSVIMVAITQSGMTSDTDVANTLVNNTIALGFVRLTKIPKSQGLSF